MKKVLFLSFTLLFLTAIFKISVNAQMGGQMGTGGIEDMQKQMMKSMQEQMLKNMGGGGMSPMMQQPAQKTVSENAARAGENVFADAGLGTNGKSCKSCHSKVGQKPLDGRKVTPHLIAFIQYCYNNALKGAGIMAENKINSLVDYFGTLEQ